MARYSALLGRRVEVQYRAGDIVLPASGTFVADSGRSVFLEQNFEQQGQHKHFRWEIPYQCVVRIAEKLGTGVALQAAEVREKPAETVEVSVEAKPEDEEPFRAAAAASVSPASRAPLSNPSKTA